MSVSVIEKNIKQIGNTWVHIMSVAFAVISTVSVFVTWEDFGITENCIKIAMLILVVLISGLCSIIWVCLIKRYNVISRNGMSKIQACYGDVVKMKLGIKNKKQKKIIVIPVNTSFDTIVDEKLEEVDKPLVSVNSIHGKWIKHLNSEGMTIEDIDTKIKNYFKVKNIFPKRILKMEEKNRGKLECYEIGEISVIDYNDYITYYLLAISKFDDNNNAESAKDIIMGCTKKLMTFYYKNGQGYPIYIPLLGTGLSNAGLSHMESFQLLKYMFQLNSEIVRGEYNIVIYPGDRDQVSIFD